MIPDRPNRLNPWVGIVAWTVAIALAFAQAGRAIGLY